MNGHGKKMIAPILVAVILIVYYLVFFGVLLWLDGLFWWIKLLGGIIPLALAGVSIFVLVERIREIRSGEEDDLSQY